MAILINGVPTSWITPERGLRQGDPLSPYLFTLIAEVLSSLLRRARQSGFLIGYQADYRLNGQSVPPALTHLLYADDLMIISTATPAQCSHIRLLLNETQALTGLTVNWNKSTVKFSPHIPRQFQRWMVRILKVPISFSIWKYLGAPLSFGRTPRSSSSQIITRIADRLASWKASLLTMAGQSTLIKSVLQANASAPDASCMLINSNHRQD
ncbi:hypothetical protein QJS10_CPB20g00858 [Acorus calamus]|uniref:Reverse transcriptase domain-containing protein n=1 Tax=Acorus calamus TaxID=4465 RepID=A0AAV9CC03_ACOCL|nr:hypothetical protein QJS10_CPB20g00858 [Acorus calamus]